MPARDIDRLIERRVFIANPHRQFDQEQLITCAQQSVDNAWEVVGEQPQVVSGSGAFVPYQIPGPQVLSENFGGVLQDLAGLLQYESLRRA